MNKDKKRGKRKDKTKNTKMKDKDEKTDDNDEEEGEGGHVEQAGFPNRSHVMKVCVRRWQVSDMTTVRRAVTTHPHF